MKVEFVVIGQGICGTLLSYELLKRGRKVLVIDNNHPHSSSRVAAGLINPVTGKRFVRSWMYDKFIEVACSTYSELEEILNVPLLTTVDMLQFHKDAAEQSAFTDKAEAEEALQQMEADKWKSFFNFSFGAGKITPCYIVNAFTLLKNWREKLKVNGALLEERFDWDQCHIGTTVTYKNIQAQKVICCDGASTLLNPYFSMLPFSLNKGEALFVTIPQLPSRYIYKHLFKIIPVKDQQFWIGSSFEWKYADGKPTAAFKEKVRAWLNNFLKVPFFIEDHIAAERPSSVDYKPFVGLHPSFDTLGILNGMGTKGYSQAPFFAQQFASYLCGNDDILPEANVQRFRNLLSKFNKA